MILGFILVKFLKNMLSNRLIKLRKQTKIASILIRLDGKLTNMKTILIQLSIQSNGNRFKSQ